MKDIILIIDSGATNSNWKFLNAAEEFEFFKFKGFNLSTSNIDQLNYDVPEKYKSTVSKIFFFGAGTGNKAKESLLKQKLTDTFSNVQQIIIGSDLVTAGLALSNKERCVISILGTGSNCCIFSDNKIEQKINNLGFILGDEGSGFRMGKTILQDYFYHKMSLEDEELFSNKYQLTRDELIQRVYHDSEKPNGYIASYCSFLIDSTPTYRRHVSFSNLDLFFQQQLTYFRGAENLEHHFSGSISWHFKQEIEDLCSKYGYKLGKIIQNPIDSLSYSKLIEL
ncbi:hypothetical protein [Portibacter lacus]|uniref:N-acetylglucosamine kinase n=1 Tax=Portibacter lacus TaxID=1099794 RepID=A0AA37WDV2_9BACT|nr:hypothetical protein [Portibacter lacus]GLR15525.1 hypothetical protein GCM10007940_01400 [Portibacter lacus]